MTSTDLTKLQNLVQVVQNLTSRVEGERVSIAFLGYTDLMLNPGEWRAMVGERTDRLVNRPTGRS